MSRNATPVIPTPCKDALCSPDVLDALDDTIEQARAVALLLSNAAPSGCAGALHSLGALLDGAAGHLEALQTNPVNLTPVNA